MSAAANPARGECALRVDGCALVLRPSFQALVAAEQELGSLFDLVVRATDGKLRIGELVALFWHCLRELPKGMTRETLGEALIGVGLTKLTPVLRHLLHQILAGR